MVGIVYSKSVEYCTLFGIFLSVNVNKLDNFYENRICTLGINRVSVFPVLEEHHGVNNWNVVIVLQHARIS